MVPYPNGGVMAEEREYKCDECGGTFLTDQSEEAVMAEAEKNFGEIFKTDPHIAVVCDDCYNLIMASLTN